MEKLSNKKRLTGTIFEETALLENLMSEFYDLKLNFLHQYFIIFRYYDGNLFPTKKTYFFRKITKLEKSWIELVNKDNEILIGTELSFEINLEWEASNSQRQGDNFYLVNNTMTEIFKHLEEIDRRLSKKNYTTSFNIKTDRGGKPKLLIMIVYKG